MYPEFTHFIGKNREEKENPNIDIVRITIQYCDLTLMHNRLICTGNFVRGDRKQSFCQISRDERAVSEILGTIMLLAMIMTIMGGVWIFLQPYMNDFEDNTNWSAAHGIADRFEDRIEVAAIAPEGSGIRHNFALQSASILPHGKWNLGKFKQM